MKKYLLIFALLIAFAGLAYAGTSIDPSRTVYLGRTLGLGGSNVADTNDGEGIFVNPSGIAGIEFPQITGLSRRIFLDETAYSLCSFAYPTVYGSFGMGFIDANTNGSLATYRDSNNRIVPNPSVEAMSYDNNVILMSYARDVSTIDKFQNLPLLLGANIKFYNQSISGGLVGSRGSAMSFDLGATYKLFKWMKVGGTLQNVLSSAIKWGNSEDKVGGFYKIGCSANILGDLSESLISNTQKLTGFLDMDIPHDVLNNNTTFNIGAEWLPIKQIALRTGLDQEPSGTTLNYGIGFIQDAFRFDYAYGPRPGIASDNPHYFSMSYTGTRITKEKKKITNKKSALKIYSPKNRSIVSLETIVVIADARYTEIFSVETDWIVPIFSTTREVKEVIDYKDLNTVLLNNVPVNQKGTIEAKTSPMPYGRNVISILGYISPESTAVSSEVAVLRFEPLEDVSMSYWAFEPIALNSTLGLLKGYPDKTFRPDRGITRAELTALLIRSLHLPQDRLNLAKEKNYYHDLPQNHWALEFINIGAEMGIVKGYPDQSFKPNKVLSKAEGISIIARFAKLPEKDFPSFPDLSEGFWGNKYITPAKEFGMLKYLEGASFEAHRDFSRAEASEVLYRSAPVQKMVDLFWEKGETLETQKQPEWLNKIVSAEAKSTTTEVKSITASITVEVKPATTEAKPIMPSPSTSEVKPNTVPHP